MLERYKAAAAASGARYAALLRNRHVVPNWMGDGDAFWYARQRTDGGLEYVLVDADAGVRTITQKIPGAVATPLVGVEDRSPSIVSPSGGQALFRRDHDLWLRDVATGEERPLTDNGAPCFAWGALPDNSMINLPMKKSERTLPPLYTAFSPSGDYVVTARLDERDYAVWPFVEHLSDEQTLPVLHHIRVRLDDDPAEDVHELAIIHLSSGRRTTIRLSADIATGLVMNGAAALTWSQDESKVYLFAHGTGQKLAQLLEFDVASGEFRVAVSECAEPIYEPNTFLYSLPLIRVLPESGEVIWFSQRDGWGHLYLYDLTTGRCKNQISAGDLVVRDLIHVDTDGRSMLFVAGCGDYGHNPYWRKLYKVSLDGGDQQLLTPEPMDHEIAAPAPQFFSLVFPESGAPARPISPSGRYFIDHMSTIDTPPRIVLRRCGDADAGEIHMELETTDASDALAAGYRPPEMFSIKVDGGTTDLWGLISVPPDATAEASAPVIDLMYAGFQVAYAPTAFLSATDMLSQAAAQGCAYAELGMATVMLDGRGTPGRDRVFRQWTHGEGPPERGLEDHVMAIRGLKSRYPMLDLDRVGVVGRSYGGYNSVRATLLFPDFFKVCVSSAGVHVPEKMSKGSWGWHVGRDRKSVV